MKYRALSTLTSLLLTSSLICPAPSFAHSIADNGSVEMGDDEISFEDMYSMPEDEFKDYCLANNLEYVPISTAEEEIKYNDAINVMIRLEGYANEGVEDVTFASDPSLLETSNATDYDFHRMILDLNLPEKYYTIPNEYDGAFRITLDESKDYDYENSQPNYLKLAAIPVFINNQNENTDLDVRLYQIAEAWCSRNDNVHSFLIEHAGSVTPNLGTATTATTAAITTTATTTTTVAADPTTKGTVQLTLNDVIELSKKGDDLTWEDFKDYISTDIGSGLYIEKYDLEDGYTLLVGGVPSTKPYYIDLYRFDDSKNSIDIRTEDVAAFLDATATMITTVAETTTATTTTTTAILTDAQGRLVDENGEVIIINDTSAVMTMPTTTTTTTTTVPDADDPITTSTAVLDYATFLEYDSSPMKVGETRTVRFYNPELKAMTNMNAYVVSENISYSYEEGSDSLTITALATGKARMYIMGEGCAFGCYLNIEVVDDSSATTPITNDGTEELPQTGYSDIYKVIAGLAALMTVSGAALVVKTRKENE